MARHAMVGSVVLPAVLLLLGCELSTDAAALRIAIGHQQTVNTAQPDVSKLEVGRAIERDLRGGESHTYEIALEAGHFLNAVVEQRGIDVVVQLIAPDHKQLIEMDSPNGTQGPEPVTTITEESGNYRLKVSPFKKEAAAGKYEVKVVELRAATDNDRELLNQLQGVRSQLSVLTLRGPGREGLEKHKETLKELEEQEEKLQNEISQSSAEFRAQSQTQSKPVTIEVIQKAIPKGSALIEFAQLSNSIT